MSKLLSQSKGGCRLICSYYGHSPSLTPISSLARNILCVSDQTNSIKRYTSYRNHGCHPFSTMSSFTKHPQTEATSSPPPTWVDTHAPKWSVPLLKIIRIDRPIGTYLLFYPCAWSTALAASPGYLPSLPVLAAFGTGALIMRGAGCIINDLWDVDYDKKVERTKSRPLAAGMLTSPQAIGFLGVNLMLGLGILLTFNNYTIMLGLCSMPVVICYPLMKRFFNYPQIILGVAMSWGALLGYPAVHGFSDWSITIPLYVGGVVWSLMYDTIYAFQDIKDDLKIGLKSSAISIGQKNARSFLAACAGGTTAMLAWTGEAAGMGVPFYTISVGGAAVHLMWQAHTVKFGDRNDCWQKFVSNQWLGALILAGIVCDKLCQKPTRADKPVV
eukprot:12584_1